MQFKTLIQAVAVCALAEDSSVSLTRSLGDVAQPPVEPRYLASLPIFGDFGKMMETAKTKLDKVKGSFEKFSAAVAHLLKYVPLPQLVATITLILADIDTGLTLADDAVEAIIDVVQIIQELEPVLKPVIAEGEKAFEEGSKITVAAFKKIGQLLKEWSMKTADKTREVINIVRDFIELKGEQVECKAEITGDKIKALLEKYTIVDDMIKTLHEDLKTTFNCSAADGLEAFFV